MPTLVVLGQTEGMLLRRSAWKFDSSHPTFQGHSRSSEPTLINPAPMTSY